MSDADVADALLNRMADQMPHPDRTLMAAIEIELYGEPYAPEPEPASYGWRWTGRTGWTVSLNRRGDIYLGDSRVPPDEIDDYLVVVLAARARSNAIVNAKELG